MSSSTQAATNNNPLDSLVAAETITQEQANSVQSVFEARGKAIQVSGTYSNKIPPQSPLDSLVTAGTITEDQKDAIESALEEARKANK